MATSTKKKLVQTAHDMFYRGGFHTTGLDQILTEVGVTKTTFYNHFESKDDLVLAVLEWHDRWWRETFVEMLRRHGGDDPRDQLAAVFDALDEVFTGEFNGCIFINVAVEFPNPNDPAHKAAASHKDSMVRIIREIAERARIDEAASFAEQFTLLMEGAYVTRHVTQKDKTADIARSLASMLLDKYLPTAA
jgi:AcrR family transcriptional regulator